MPTSSTTGDDLSVLENFGTDPGSLSADTYIPKNFPKNGPLVVVLHGSTQSAASYDTGSGWSTLADECGMALLFPGQRRANNLIGSFNWFETGDSQRGGGEPLSIRQMIKQVVDDHGVNPSRVFITGMSSGGAMTSVMLATYPEVFAGGAIIAGLPYRSATNMMQAFVRMNGYGSPSDNHLDALVRGASNLQVHGRRSLSGMATEIQPSIIPTPARSSGSGRRFTRSKDRRHVSRRSTAFLGKSGATRTGGW